MNPITDPGELFRVRLLDPDRGLAPLADAFAEVMAGAGEVDSVPSFAALSADLPALDLVVLDLDRGDGRRDGLAVLRELRALAPELPVIVTAAAGDVDSATRAIRAGATDFLVRAGRLPERVSAQLAKVKNLLALAANNRRLRLHNLLLAESAEPRFRIFGRSPQVRQVLARIDEIARVPRPVLITGERGTGKELVARAIHRAGGPDRPFVVANCAAFADTLLESELFGHERGAFTGAEARVPGRFEQARGGTLFLDEIGNMSLAFQQKILRAVEYGSFTRVGGANEVRAECRIISATNADLREAMAQGRFLPDLFDRLAFDVIALPPLREREGDIDLLANYFLEQFMREMPALRGKTITPEARAALARYPFPGNVRELKTIIERAACRDRNQLIEPWELGLDLPAGRPTASAASAPPLAQSSREGAGKSVSPGAPSAGGPMGGPPHADLTDLDPAGAKQGATFFERVEAMERNLIFLALQDAGGNQAQAARALGLSYPQFRYYFRKFGGVSHRGKE